MTDLAQVLRRLPPHNDPNLLSGAGIGDDAAVYRLSADLALVQTVDFFTPVVDDPYTFGQIAAANSLSDVYAVGGRPLTALNIAAFPIKSLPASVLGEILRGGADKAREAGVTIAGGHTVDDEEPKYGLAVTGTVHPDRYLSGVGALPGDLLVLTKPVGTGVVATAVKAAATNPDHVRQAVRWMTALNRQASEAMMEAKAHAVTDITGFGLLGHLVELCRSSAVAATLSAPRVPLLPGALRYAGDGYIPGGTLTNRAALERTVRFDPTLDEETRTLLYDPQTSGGLLICLHPDYLPVFRRRLDGTGLSAVIGEIKEGEAGSVRVTSEPLTAGH